MKLKNKIIILFLVPLLLEVVLSHNIIFDSSKNNIEKLNSIRKFETLKKEFIKNKGVISTFIFNESASEQVIIGKDKWLFYNDKNSINNFKGIKILDEVKRKSLINKMTIINNWSKEKNKKAIFWIAPNKETIYGKSYLKTNYKTIDTKNSSEILASLANEHDIEVRYPKTILGQNKEEYYTYYKNDTHWNQYGALIGSIDLFANHDPNLIQMSDFTLEILGQKSGDLVGMGGLNSTYYNSDLKVNYLEDSDIKSVDTPIVGMYLKYQVFENDKAKGNIQLIGDSFLSATQAIIPNYFNSTTYIHRSDFKIEYFDVEADIIVFEIVERFLGDFESSLDLFINQVISVD